VLGASPAESKGRDPGLLDDLVQEVFARLLASEASLGCGRDPVPYLVSIGRNLHIDRLRRARAECLSRYRRVSTAAERAETQEHAVEEPEADDLDRVALQRLVEIVSGLPVELRAVYDARYVRNLSQRDAAAFLGVSRRQVRTAEERLLSRARGCLLAAPERRGQARLGAVGTRRVPRSAMGRSAGV
jgi:RNA polymerase sigma factor (sigma-70 family)